MNSTNSKIGNPKIYTKTLETCFKKKRHGTVDMAQPLKALTILPEDLDLVPSTHMVAPMSE